MGGKKLKKIKISSTPRYRDIFLVILFTNKKSNNHHVATLLHKKTVPADSHL